MHSKGAEDTKALRADFFYIPENYSISRKEVKNRGNQWQSCCEEEGGA